MSPALGLFVSKWLSCSWVCYRAESLETVEGSALYFRKAEFTVDHPNCLFRGGSVSVLQASPVLSGMLDFTFIIMYVIDCNGHFYGR
jgi:hypothetical protein